MSLSVHPLAPVPRASHASSALQTLTLTCGSADTSGRRRQGALLEVESEGGLGAQERVGGSCEIGGRLRGRLDHPPPPPSARSCLLAGATGHKKRQDGRLRLQGVRRGLHRPLETVKHVFKRLTAKAAGDGWAKEGGEGSKRRKEMQRG